MLVHQLVGQLPSLALPPVLLFCPGEAPFQKEPFEPVLADRAIERIVAAYVDPSVRDMAYVVFHADETEPAEIVAEACTLPFLAERRVVVVRNAERYAGMSSTGRRSPLAPLIAYLESPADTTLLVMVAVRVDKRTKFYRLCHDHGLIVECPQLDDAELARWVCDEAQRYGKNIGGDAVVELVRRAGSRLSDVANAVALAANFVGDAPTIREQDVNTACADVAEESVWALTDAIAASNPEKALGALHQLTDLGKSPDELMGLINWLLDSAYRAAPGTKATLQSRFVGRKVMPLAQKLGVEKLKDAFALCTSTHFMMRSTGVDKTLALELLVIKLAAPRRRPASR